jgi:hypothetical protein
LLSRTHRVKGPGGNLRIRLRLINSLDLTS